MCGVQRKSAPFIVFCALQISKNRVKMSCHDILSRIHVKLVKSYGHFKFLFKIRNFGNLRAISPWEKG